MWRGNSVQKCNSQQRITTDDFDDEIEKSTNVGNSLESIITQLERLYCRKLGKYDLFYVEEKYVDLQINNYLLEKVPEKITKSINVNNLLEYINKLNTLTDLDQCCNFLSEYLDETEEKHLSALKQLCATSNKVKLHEKQYINEFIRKCYTIVHLKADYVSGELDFNICLTELLKSTKYPAELCKRLGLLPEVVKDFENDLCFKNFLTTLQHINTFNNKYIYKLQNSAKLIINQNNFLLNKNIINTIESYLKKPIFKESYFDGRFILEISGKHIVISKVLEEIEKKLGNSHVIEEVRFVQAGVVHIDVGLSASIWHGKNLVVFAETVYVSGDKKVTWDVSGKDAEHTDWIEAGTDANGIGLSGADGQHGESGGNVQFIVRELKNSQNLKVRSNGGNGGIGQNGGIGIDGRDGVFLEEDKFKELFPPVAKFRDSKKDENLECTKNNLLMMFKSVKTFFYGQSFMSGTISKVDFEKYFTNVISSKCNIYFELCTNNGCKITFSFYYGDVTTACHALLLHEGSLGEEGKSGGCGGKGGKGGYAGEITIRVDDGEHADISLSRAAGYEGNPGKLGMDGSPGKKGVDRGYTDYSRDTPIFGKWPKYYFPGSNDNIRLHIDYSKETSGRVFCPHKDLYAEIVEKPMELTRHTRYRENINVLSSHHEVHIPRKKAIIEDTVRKQYEENLCGTDLFKWNRFIEEVKQSALELVMDTGLQTEQITADLKVVRQISYRNETSTVLSRKNSNMAVKQDHRHNITNISPTELVKLINENPGNLDIWKQFSQARLKIIDFQTLWNIFDNTSLENHIYKQIYIVFYNKYQLACLEWLAQNVENSCCVSELRPNAYMLKYFNKLLTINEEQTFTNVEEYLLRDSPEKRKEALKLFTDKLDSATTNRNVISNTLLVFFNEFSCNPVVKKTLEEVQKFEKSKEKLLAEKLLAGKLIALKSALARSKIYNSLIESVVKQTNQDKINFENEIQEDRFFKILYLSYVKSTKHTCNWENVLISNDHAIVQLLVNNGVQNGPLCAFYRELLAYQFETNIMVYTRNEKNEIILAHNHNPTANTMVHLLMKEKGFLKLKINNELVDMVYNQTNQGALLHNILIQIDRCSDKNHLNQLISEIPLCVLAGSYNGVENCNRTCARITYIIMEENNIMGVLKAYNEDKDKQIINCRLEKLKFQYTGCESILYYLALHFDCEGALISAEELCLFLNFILKCALNMPHTIPLLSWIVAAYPQEQWLVEVILLKIELNFSSKINQDVTLKWRKYLHEQTDRDILMLVLNKISDKDTSPSKEKIEEILYLLSRIPINHIDLKQLDFEDWKYYLRDKFWIYQLKPIADWSNEQLETASYYLMNLENIVGTGLCKNLVQVLLAHMFDLTSESTKELVVNYLKTFTNKEVHLNDKLLEYLKGIPLSEWKSEIDKQYFSSKEDRKLDDILEVVKYRSSTSDNVLNKLNTIDQVLKDSDEIKNMLEKLDNKQFNEWISKVLLGNGEKSKSVLDQIKEYIKLPTITDETFVDLGKQILRLFPQSTTPEANNMQKSDGVMEESILMQEKSLSVVFAAVITAVERKLKFKIRDTQKLAIMTMLKCNGNILSQISTGEGKSIIIVIVAIIKALNRQKVDIITSSHVLAERDADRYKEVYSIFNVTVDHNYSENIEIRKKVYSNNNVVYGELANFQRDYLLDRIYNENLLGDRTLEIVIVDEVDSMLLDKGNNILYLSHEIPGLDKLEEVFTYIWVFLNTLSGQPNMKFIVSELKKNILNEIFGLVTKDDLKNLDTELDSSQLDLIYNLLVKNKIISSNGKLLVKDYSSDLLPETCIKKYHLCYLIRKIVERKKKIIIPNYLNEFVEAHIEEWIKSGIRAMSMEPSVDYVVDVDRTGTSSDISPNIIIIDRDTGTDLINSQWEDGLHQFLQLKHGCRLSIISLKAVFKSNVSYLKEYKTLFGLTGTIGSTKERHLLEEIYKVDFIMIPTAKTKLFTEEEPVLCTSADEWTTRIWKNVCTKIRQNRSVLIICETVRDVNIIIQKFDHVSEFKQIISPMKIHPYKRDYEQLEIAKNLEPGHVIISTNLAGRGTDIILSDELKKAGGLHVCLSFLPSNRRVEEQAYGRAARNGEPGSAQMVFKSNSHKTTSNTNVIDLKKQTEFDEVVRIADIKNFNTFHIQPQERCLKKFLDLYEDIYNDSSLGHDENIKKILLQASLDKWAFWLEKNKCSKDLNSSNSFIEEIEQLCSKNYDKHIEDPSQLSKLGLLLIDNNKFDQAIKLFDRVVKNEPSFSENARYYRLCANMVKRNINSEDIKTESTLIVKLLKERIQSLLLLANIIDHLKKKNHNNILQVQSFKDQHIIICKTYEIFLENIYSIVGHGFDAQRLAVPHTVIDEECASRIYNDLLRKDIITVPQIKKNISSGDLEFVTLYGIITTKLLTVLNFYGKENPTIDKHNLLKVFKQNYLVPSRELFWKQLLKKKILVNEEKYSIVDIEKLKMVDPSLSVVVDSLKITNKLEEDNQIWLYQIEDIDCFDEKEFALTKKANLKMELGEYKYRLLKHKYVIHPNRHATLLELQNNIIFDYFDCLTREDFCRVNVSSELALEIIHELEEKHVIQKLDDNKYSLTIQSRDIGNVKLSRFKAYSDDVVNLLTVCFAFRLALEKTWDLLNKQTINTEPICLPLKIRLEKQILHDLYDKEIITQSLIKPNADKQITKTVESLYPNKWTREQLNLIFSDLFELDTTRTNIIECLIEHKWLIEDKELKLDSFLTHTRYSFQKENLNKLPSTVEKYSETIKLVLKRHVSLSEPYCHSHIKQFVYQYASSINGIEKPSLSLVPLSDVIKEHKMPLRECTIFVLNGFDKLIVLEEMKYSTKMIVSTFVVALLGIIEITVGTVYGLPKFVEQGAGDLEYVVSCMLSGHFSWNDYSSQKVSSIVQSVGNSMMSFVMSGKFKSSMGQKLSLSSMWNTSQRTTVRTVAMEIVKHSVKTCVVAGSYVAIDNVIEPKLAELGVTLLNQSTSDVDNIVDEHPVVESLKKLYLQLGQENAAQIVKFNSGIVMQKYKTKNFKDLLLIFGKLHVNLMNSINMIKNNTNMKDLSYGDMISCISRVSKIIEGISDLIKCRGYLKELQLITIANEMTDSLHNLLEQTYNGLRTRSQLDSTQISHQSAEVFVTEIKVSWKQGINDVYSYNINKIIIHPLINSLKGIFTAALSHKTKNNFVPYREDEDLSAYKLDEKFKCSEGFNNSEDSKDLKIFLCMEYDDCLAELFIKTQSASIFLEILKHSSTVDISFIKLCCYIIPTALKTQGLDLPMLQIVIDHENVQPISGSDVSLESEVLTLHITPNANFLEHLKNNKILIRAIFNALYKSVVQFIPQLKKYNGQYIRNLVTKAIEENSSILKDICTDYSVESRNDVCNTSFEDQNAVSLGKSVSLQSSERNEAICFDNKSSKIQQCVIDGFKTALEKINHHLCSRHPYLKQFKLKLSDFAETQHEIIPSKRLSMSCFDCYATKYELLLPLENENNKLQVNYNVTMSLVGKPDRRAFHRPNGPHIVYKMNPVEISNAQLIKEGTEGVVSLDFENEYTIYSVKDCKCAGDLVLPILL